MCCSVNVSVCFVCCVFDRVCELFGETIRNVFGCSCYFVSEVMEVFSVCGGALLIRPYMVLRAGSQAFSLLMLFLCVILHTISSGKSMQLLCILPVGMLCLSAISMMFVKIMLAVCMLVGMVV